MKKLQIITTRTEDDKDDTLLHIGLRISIDGKVVFEDLYDDETDALEALEKAVKLCGYDLTWESEFSYDGYDEVIDPAEDLDGFIASQYDGDDIIGHRG